MDGCFDMMHYGHANALRQAKAFGDYLIVGVVSDSEILANKGPPVFNESERIKMVEAVKWVDEVITDVPYEITEDFMKKLFTKYKVDYIIHGDDPCLLPDGRDAYELAKKAGRYREVKRTEGVSSTDIVGRMLLCYNQVSTPSRRRLRTKTKSMEMIEQDFSVGSDSEYDFEDDGKSSSPTPSVRGGGSARTRLSQFMPTSRRLIQFANHSQASSNARVVYIDGAFDMFHTGHVEILRLARQRGDYLIVGLHDDHAISEQRGRHYPIMSLHERSLSVLACKHVDEIIIGAPMEVSKELLTTFNISLVLHGTVYEAGGGGGYGERYYSVPIEQNMFVEIASPSTITVREIINRIMANRGAFEEKFKRKHKSEAAYHNEKTYVAEK